MSWTKQAKKDMQGNFLKLKKDGDELIVTFLGDPKIKTLSSSYDEHGKPLSAEQKKNIDGDTGLIIGAKTYNAYQFPVTVDGELKELSITQRGLLALIVEEHEEESIYGRTFKIKQVGESKSAQYRLKELPTNKEQHGRFEEARTETIKGSKTEVDEEKLQEESISGEMAANAATEAFKGTQTSSIDEFEKAANKEKKPRAKKEKLNKGDGEGDQPLVM